MDKIDDMLNCLADQSKVVVAYGLYKDDNGHGYSAMKGPANDVLIVIYMIIKEFATNADTSILPILRRLTYFAVTDGGLSREELVANTEGLSEWEKKKVLESFDAIKEEYGAED